MYAMLGTRMDIAYSILFFSRYLRNSGPQHIRATKRIIQYFYRATKLELNFCKDFKLLVRYTDLDWVEDIETYCSTVGILFNIGSRIIS